MRHEAAEESRSNHDVLKFTTSVTVPSGTRTARVYPLWPIQIPPFTRSTVRPARKNRRTQNRRTGGRTPRIVTRSVPLREFERGTAAPYATRLSAE
jgi:hypothetical protein